MRLSAEQVRDELQRGGYRMTQTQAPDLLPLQYMLTAEPASAAVPEP